MDVVLHVDLRADIKKDTCLKTLWPNLIIIILIVKTMDGTYMISLKQDIQMNHDGKNGCNLNWNLLIVLY